MLSAVARTIVMARRTIGNNADGCIDEGKRRGASLKTSNLLRLLEAAIGERMVQVRVTPEPALVATVYGRVVACVDLIGGKNSICSRPRLASARCRYG